MNEVGISIYLLRFYFYGYVQMEGGEKLMRR
jgi:hypothetical protein